MMMDMQFGGFTHAKCTNCGHLGAIDAFPLEKEQYQKNEFVESYIAVYSCPICNDKRCEPLFANEVN